jgi:hypothetical protein
VVFKIVGPLTVSIAVWVCHPEVSVFVLTEGSEQAAPNNLAFLARLPNRAPGAPPYCVVPRSKTFLKQMPETQSVLLM